MSHSDDDRWNRFRDDDAMQARIDAARTARVNSARAMAAARSGNVSHAAWLMGGPELALHYLRARDRPTYTSSHATLSEAPQAQATLRKDAVDVLLQKRLALLFAIGNAKGWTADGRRDLSDQVERISSAAGYRQDRDWFVRARRRIDRWIHEAERVASLQAVLESIRSVVAGRGAERAAHPSGDALQHALRAYRQAFIELERWAT